MIICAHDTMTYRKVKEWYLKPVKFIARCQRHDYKTLHEKYNVNCFDIRLFWDQNDKLEYRHGPISYDASDFTEVLKYCEDNNIILRIFFEDRYFPKSLRKRSSQQNLGQKFTDTCKWIEETYPNLKCFGGCSTEGDVKYYTFKYDGKYKCVHYYSSQTSLFKSNNKTLRIIDDWCPIIYATFKNKENWKKCKELYKDDDNTIVLFDFI